MDLERLSPEELLAHSAWLRKLALALVGDASSAEDLVQDTLASWIRHGEVAEGFLRPWLVRVMKNLARTRWRSELRRRQREVSSARSERHESEDVAATLETHDLLFNAVKELGPAYRSVIVRHYFEGESLAQIARSGEVAESTVRNRLQRALDELRERLDRRRGGRDSWVALLVSFAARRQPSVMLPASSAASAATTGFFGWAAWSSAVVVILLSFGWWMWSERKPASATQRDLVAAADASRIDRADESSALDARAAADRTALAGAPPPSVGGSPSRSPSLAVVEARIVDTAGHPIAGAELSVADPAELSDIDPAAAPRARAASDGRARIEAHPSDRSRPAQPTNERATPKSAERWRLRVEASAPDRATCSEFAELEAGRVTSLGDIVLGPGGALEGRVTAKDGSELPPCRVEILPITAIAEARGAQSIRHDERVAQTLVKPDGSYYAAGVPVGIYRVVVAPDVAGWRTAPSATIDVRAGETRSVRELLLERRDTRITGTIRARDLAPVRGATVAYVETAHDDASFDRWKRVRTDDVGRFTIDLEHDVDCDLFVQGDAEDAGDVLMNGVAAGTQDLDLRLPYPTSAELFVVDESGEPIPRFEMSSKWARTARPFRSIAANHPGGRAQVPLHAKPYYVTVAADGRAEREIGPIDSRPRSEPIRVVLLALAAVHGCVTASDAAVANARIELHALVDDETKLASNGFPDRMRLVPSVKPQHTIQDGTFELFPRESGRYVLVVRAPGFADFESAPFEYDASVAGASHGIALSLGGTLHGRVITEPTEAAPSGSPAGVIVGISRGDGSCRTMRVDVDGTIRFEHLAAGRWAIRRCERDFNAEGGVTRSAVGGFDPSLAYFDVEDGHTTHYDLDLRGAECVLDGKLDSSACDGCACTATLIALPRVPGVKHPQVALASDGSFRLEAAVLGPHELLIERRSVDRCEQTIEASVDLQRGTNAWTLALATGVIEGEAERGAELVHTWTNARGTTSTTRCSADSDGRFRLTGAPAGPGTLARAKAFAAMTVDVRANTVLHVRVD